MQLTEVAPLAAAPLTVFRSSPITETGATYLPPPRTITALVSILTHHGDGCNDHRTQDRHARRRGDVSILTHHGDGCNV